MKLNDVNQIEEGVFSAIKDRFKQGGQQTTIQNIFIKDFVQDAITSLNNGVKGGLIDPNIKSTGPSSNTQFGTATPAGAGPATGAAGSTVTPSNTANPLTAPTISGAPKTSVSTTVAPGGTPGGITTGGVARTPAKPAASTKPYSWSPQGMNINPDTKISSLGAVGQAAKESRHYNKLNAIFESIVNIDEADQLRTIADYMMDWFGQYMKGVTWESSKSVVQQKINKLQDEYPKNVDANLKDLARIGLALSKAGSPAGAPPEFANAKKEMTASIADLKGTLENLSKSDPRAYNELIKNLKPVQVGFFNEDTK